MELGECWQGFFKKKKKRQCIKYSSFCGSTGWAGRALLAGRTAWSNAEVREHGAKKCLAPSDLKLLKWRRAVAGKKKEG